MDDLIQQLAKLSNKDLSPAKVIHMGRVLERTDQLGQKGVLEGENLILLDNGKLNIMEIPLKLLQLLLGDDPVLQRAQRWNSRWQQIKGGWQALGSYQTHQLAEVIRKQMDISYYKLRTNFENPKVLAALVEPMKEDLEACRWVLYRVLPDSFQHVALGPEGNRILNNPQAWYETVSTFGLKLAKVGYVILDGLLVVVLGALHGPSRPGTTMSVSSCFAGSLPNTSIAGGDYSNPILYNLRVRIDENFVHVSNVSSVDSLFYALNRQSALPTEIRFDNTKILYKGEVLKQGYLLRKYGISHGGDAVALLRDTAKPNRELSDLCAYLRSDVGMHHAAHLKSFLAFHFALIIPFLHSNPGFTKALHDILDDVWRTLQAFTHQDVTTGVLTTFQLVDYRLRNFRKGSKFRKAFSRGEIPEPLEELREYILRKSPPQLHFLLGPKATRLLYSPRAWGKQMTTIGEAVMQRGGILHDAISQIFHDSLLVHLSRSELSEQFPAHQDASNGSAMDDLSGAQHFLFQLSESESDGGL